MLSSVLPVTAFLASKASPGGVNCGTPRKPSSSFWAAATPEGAAAVVLAAAAPAVLAPELLSLPPHPATTIAAPTAAAPITHRLAVLRIASPSGCCLRYETTSVCKPKQLARASASATRATTIRQPVEDLTGTLAPPSDDRPAPRMTCSRRRLVARRCAGASRDAGFGLAVCVWSRPDGRAARLAARRVRSRECAAPSLGGVSLRVVAAGGGAVAAGRRW